MNKSELIQFLRSNEIWAKKSMGQNFLIDEEALGKIVAAADLQSSDTVVEIGPGLGVMTEELAKHAGKVIAIEKDDKFAEMLISKFQITRDKSQTNYKLKIINQDALEFNPKNLGSYKLVANIPYNITSLIIRKFLETDNKPELLVLLVQKEAAERIVAKPGEMSLLSVSVQFYADAEIIDIVPSSSFFPVPKVDSAVIKLKVHKVDKVHKVHGREFFRIVKFGFASKRKTLENNLAAGMHIQKSDAADIIKRAGLDAKVRAEELSVENWIKLYNLVNR